MSDIKQRMQGWLQKRLFGLAGLEHWMDMSYGQSTNSGKAVNESSALQYAALFACVRVLSETVAYLPLNFYERLEPRGKRKAAGHHLHPILHDQPNPEMTSFSWREALEGHLTTWGNCYNEIELDRDGKVKHLWPLRPDRVQIERRKGELYYIYTLPGSIGKTVVLPAYRVLHIPGFGFDGIKGYSPISLFREVIGMGLSVEEYGARFFGSGGKPGGVLQHPGKLKPESKNALRKDWQEMHGGLQNQHRVAILEEGMKYEQIGIPPDDAQFLETRKFQKREIASIYRIPPHMIADLDNATFSNIEHQSIDFVVHTIGPWLKRWEQAINTKLLGPNERKQYFAEFLVEGLLRGDTQSRYNAYSIGRQWGWLSANDVRELENQNPLPDKQGDIYLVPMNMVPAEAASSEPKEPEQTNDQTREARRIIKPGEERSAAIRHNTAVAHRRVLRESADRLAKKEATAVMRQAKKILKNRSIPDWEEWLERFYTEFPKTIEQQMGGAVNSLGEAITVIAAGEVNADPKVTPELQRLLNKYNNTLATSYAGNSKGQLGSLVREAVENEQDPFEVVEQRVTEWEEKRPGKIAVDQSTRVSGYMAKAVFISAGIVRLVWRNTGSRTCPFCEEMDGRVVGIDQPFVDKGQTLNAEEKDHVMRVYKPAFYPPLHQGCECQVLPE